MTDDDKALVSELRADAAMHADLLPDRAADSITRLSDVNERLRDAVNDAVSMIGKIGQERTDLRAENERLRAALEPLAEMAERYDPEDDDGSLECWSRYATPRIKHLRDARAALSQTQARKGEEEE